MNFWIGVAFFCLSDTCAFWKADQNFYSKEKCEARVEFVMKEVTDAGGIANGVCLPIKPGQA